MTGQDDLLLAGGLDVVPAARHYARDRVLAAGLDDLAGDVELVVTELVTNALLHAGPPVTLTVHCADDSVRLDVADRSRATPVRPRASTDAMTGRGLALVDALALRWGVDPQVGGKVVWCELGAGGSGPDRAEALADGDELDALLAAWADDEPSEERYTVRLGNVPTELLLTAKAHVDNVLRELTLAAATAEAGGSSSVPLPLLELLESVAHGFADARQSIKRQALASASRGDVRTDLTLSLTAASIEAGEQYLDALDQADAYARAARLLTLESPPQHRVFRHWYVTSLVTQLRSLSGDEQPPRVQSFSERLLEELDVVVAAQRTAERAAQLQSMTAALGGLGTVAEVARVVVDEGVRTLGASGGSLLRPGGESGLLNMASVGYNDRLLQRLRAETSHSLLPAAVALRSGEPIWLESTQERDDQYPALAELEPAAVALCAVPLVAGERVLGVLRFSFDAPRLFDEDERRFVLALAAQSAQAIDRSLLYAAEQSARADAEALATRLSRLQRVAGELGAVSDVDRVTEIMVKHAAAAAGSGLAALSLVTDEQTLQFVRMGGARAETERRWDDIPLSAELPAAVAVRTGEPVVVENAAELARRFPLLAELAPAETSLVCVPLRAGSRAIGAVSLTFPGERQRHTSAELAFLGSLADSCAQAIERSRALAELREATDKLAFLAEASTELAASLDYRGTLANIARLVVPRLADWCSVHLFEDGRVDLVALAHVDAARAGLAEKLHRLLPFDPAAPGGMAQVLRTGVGQRYHDYTAQSLQDAGRDPEAVLIAVELGVRSVLVVPLAGRNGTLGTITMCFAESGRRYSAGDLEFASDVARRAAVAVENARAYRSSSQASHDPAAVVAASPAQALPELLRAVLARLQGSGEPLPDELATLLAQFRP